MALASQAISPRTAGERNPSEKKWHMIDKNKGLVGLGYHSTSQGYTYAGCGVQLNGGMDQQNPGNIPAHRRCNKPGCRKLWPAITNEPPGGL